MQEKRKEAEMNCIVCAIAKQENRYIYEWAKHHLEIGFKHLHIYDNNDVDGERIEDVFRGTDIEGDVTVHDVRGMKCMQLKVYQECYEREDFDWCAFIDIDEFITLTDPKMTIAAFLEDKQDYEAVHLNWLCYGDDGQLKSDGRGVRERLRNPIQPIDFRSQYITLPDNAHIKSIICKGLKIEWEKPCEGMSYATPHTPGLLTKVCNERGEKVKNLPWARMNHEKAYVAHYITKTIEEYSVKVGRTAADSNMPTHLYSRFFRYNTMTIRKLGYIYGLNRGKKGWDDIREVIRESILWWHMRHHTKVASRSLKYKNRMALERTLPAIE